MNTRSLLSRWLRRGILFLFTALLVLSITSCKKKEEVSSSTIVTQRPVTTTAPSSDQEEDDKLTILPPDADTLKRLQEARGNNEDTVAWLSVPGTTIDAPVMQAGDNEYYLRKDENGQYNFFGCYFADFECTVAERNSISRNTVIYGHNMDDNRVHGEKFAQLIKYLDEDFARNHPYVYLTTEDDQMIFKIFAVFYSDTHFNYIAADPGDLAFMDILNEAKERSEYNYEVGVNATDKIITLSTCTYKYGMREDQRYVVMARLLWEGEDAPQTVEIEKNPSPKAPQF